MAAAGGGGNETVRLTAEVTREAITVAAQMMADFVDKVTPSDPMVAVLRAKTRDEQRAAWAAARGTFAKGVFTTEGRLGFGSILSKQFEGDAEKSFQDAVLQRVRRSSSVAAAAGRLDDGALRSVVVSAVAVVLPRKCMTCRLELSTTAGLELAKLLRWFADIGASSKVVPVEIADVAAFALWLDGNSAASAEERAVLEALKVHAMDATALSRLRMHGVVDALVDFEGGFRGMAPFALFSVLTGVVGRMVVSPPVVEGAEPRTRAPTPIKVEGAVRSAAGVRAYLESRMVVVRLSSGVFLRHGDGRGGNLATLTPHTHFLHQDCLGRTMGLTRDQLFTRRQRAEDSLITRGTELAQLATTCGRGVTDNVYCSACADFFPSTRLSIFDGKAWVEFDVGVDPTKVLRENCYVLYHSANNNGGANMQQGPPIAGVRHTYLVKRVQPFVGQFMGYREGGAEASVRPVWPTPGVTVIVRSNQLIPLGAQVVSSNAFRADRSPSPFDSLPWLKHWDGKPPVRHLGAEVLSSSPLPPLHIAAVAHADFLAIVAQLAAPLGKVYDQHLEKQFGSALYADVLTRDEAMQEAKLLMPSAPLGSWDAEYLLGSRLFGSVLRGMQTPTPLGDLADASQVSLRSDVVGYFYLIVFHKDARSASSTVKNRPTRRAQHMRFAWRVMALAESHGGVLIEGLGRRGETAVVGLPANTAAVDKFLEHLAVDPESNEMTDDLRAVPCPTVFYVGSTDMTFNDVLPYHELFQPVDTSRNSFVAALPLPHTALFAGYSSFEAKRFEDGTIPFVQRDLRVNSPRLNEMLQEATDSKHPLLFGGTDEFVGLGGIGMLPTEEWLREWIGRHRLVGVLAASPFVRGDAAWVRSLVAEEDLPLPLPSADQSSLIAGSGVVAFPTVFPKVARYGVRFRNELATDAASIPTLHDMQGIVRPFQDAVAGAESDVEAGDVPSEERRAAARRRKVLLQTELTADRARTLGLFEVHKLNAENFAATAGNLTMTTAKPQKRKKAESMMMPTVEEDAAERIVEEDATGAGGAGGTTTRRRLSSSGAAAEGRMKEFAGGAAFVVMGAAAGGGGGAASSSAAATAPSAVRLPNQPVALDRVGVVVDNGVVIRGPAPTAAAVASAQARIAQVVRMLVPDRGGDVVVGGAAPVATAFGVVAAQGQQPLWLVPPRGVGAMVDGGVVQALQTLVNRGAALVLDPDIEVFQVTFDLGKLSDDLIKGLNDKSHALALQPQVLDINGGDAKAVQTFYMDKIQKDRITGDASGAIIFHMEAQSIAKRVTDPSPSLMALLRSQGIFSAVGRVEQVTATNVAAMLAEGVAAAVAGGAAAAGGADEASAVVASAVQLASSLAVQALENTSDVEAFNLFSERANGTVQDLAVLAQSATVTLAERTASYENISGMFTRPNDPFLLEAIAAKALAEAQLNTVLQSMRYTAQLAAESMAVVVRNAQVFGGSTAQAVFGKAVFFLGRVVAREAAMAEQLPPPDDRVAMAQMSQREATAAQLDTAVQLALTEDMAALKGVSEEVAMTKQVLVDCYADMMLTLGLQYALVPHGGGEGRLAAVGGGGLGVVGQPTLNARYTPQLWAFNDTSLRNLRALLGHPWIQQAVGPTGVGVGTVLPPLAPPRQGPTIEQLD